jgi:hypothetical protein
MFEMNDILVKKTHINSKLNNHLSVEKNFIQLLNSCICIYIICDIFCMIECSFDVIDLSIFVIYDGRNVVLAYSSKIN